MSAAFRFRLQSLLELREQSERDSARGLAEARRDAESARRAREDLEAAREAGRTRLTRAHGAGGAVGHLQNLAYVVSQVEDRIRVADEACRAAEEEVVARLEHYREAMRSRKTIEGIRERKLLQWRTDEVRSEQKAMDEVALTRHGRGDADTGSPS